MNSPRKGLYGMEIPEGYKVRFRDFWRKSYLLDYLFIILTAGLAFPLWQYVHPTNSWFRMDDPELSFPSRNPVIAESVVLVLIFVPPPVIFVILQIYFRNLHDLHTAILGFIEVIALTALYHAFIWISLGQPRPDFLSICKPVADGVCSDPGRSDLIDARHGFPSGHAAFLFAAALYVTFYCWGKWETFRGSAFFPMQILLWGYVLLAVAVGCTRVADGEHSSWGVIAGLILGFVFAFVTYLGHYPPFWKKKAGIPYLRTWSLRQMWNLHNNRLVTPRFCDFE